MTWAFAERWGEKSSSFVAAAEREIVPARIAEKIENAFIRAPDLILNLVVQRNWRKRKWGAVGARAGTSLYLRGLLRAFGRTFSSVWLHRSALTGLPGTGDRCAAGHAATAPGFGSGGLGLSGRSVAR